MPDRTTAVIDWTLEGKVRAPPGGKLRAAVSSTFELDQITGRVRKHSEDWEVDSSVTSAPTKLAAAAARSAWAAARAAEDAAAGTGKLLESLSSTDGDDDEAYYSPDPTDPTKFFQSNDEEQMMRDAFTFAGALAIFWGLARAWSQLEGMKF